MPLGPWGMDAKFGHRFGKRISPFIELSRVHPFR